MGRQENSSSGNGSNRKFGSLAGILDGPGLDPDAKKMQGSADWRRFKTPWH